MEKRRILEWLLGVCLASNHEQYAEEHWRPNGDDERVAQEREEYEQESLASSVLAHDSY